MTSPGVGARHRLALEQVSALCLRHGGTELVAVGDEQPVVLTAPLADGAIGAPERHDVEHRGGSSEWEAVAADGTGRVFVIEERQAIVTVLAPDLRRREHELRLRAGDGPDVRAARLLDGDNRGPEGMVLLAGGHVLVVKQRTPVLLIEFGSLGDSPLGFAPLPAGEAFPLARADLYPLRSWALRDEATIESANDLAFDGAGRLHAISSRSRLIYALRAEGDGDAVAEPRWPLPGATGADREHKAEGLVFDPGDRPIVALDVRDAHDNVFVLSPLVR